MINQALADEGVVVLEAASEGDLGGAEGSGGEDYGGFAGLDVVDLAVGCGADYEAFDVPGYVERYQHLCFSGIARHKCLERWKLTLLHHVPPQNIQSRAPRCGVSQSSSCPWHTYD